MKTIAAFIIKNLNCIHAGSTGQKVLSLTKLAAAPAVGISLMERFSGWYIDNQVFITFVLFSIMIDMILGVWVHFLKHDFSSKKLVKGFLTKTMVLIFGYVIFEMLHQIMSDIDLVAGYFKVTLQLIVLLYPAGSALGNIFYLSGGKFPPLVWMKRFDKFNRDGDINSLKPNKDEKSLDTPDDCSTGNGLPNA